MRMAFAACLLVSSAVITAPSLAANRETQDNDARDVSQGAWQTSRPAAATSPAPRTTSPVNPLAVAGAPVPVTPPVDAAHGGWNAHRGGNDAGPPRVPGLPAAGRGGDGHRGGHDGGHDGGRHDGDHGRRHHGGGGGVILFPFPYGNWYPTVPWPYPDAQYYPNYPTPDEPDDADMPPPPDMQQASRPFWYYCDKPDGYYPYVKECSHEWSTIPISPPPPGAAPPISFADWQWCEEKKAFFPYVSSCPKGFQPVPVTTPRSVVTLPEAANWYFCDDPKGYLPYVVQCKNDWRPVPSIPPPSVPITVKQAKVP